MIWAYYVKGLNIMAIIDLSVSIVSQLPVDPPAQMANIQYIDHQESVPTMLSFFPGATANDLPQGLGWAIEQISLTTHTGTHLDAPYHYHPTMNGGERSLTIDEIPLEWCIGNGVVIDFSDRPDGYVCTAEDVKQYLEARQYTLQAGDIVLIHTSAMEHYGTPAYLQSGCGMGREATLWLIEQGVKVMGTNAWSWDAPLPTIAERYKETGDASLIWEGHFAGIEKAYCHIEKLCHLEQLPFTGFQFIGLPIKIDKASAGWIRAIAIVPD